MVAVRGQSVLISGASSGIGEFLARELVWRGARVGLLARREERLRELTVEIEHSGGRAAWATADVADGAALSAALDALEADLEGVDVVIANAGYGRPDPPYKPGSAIKMYDVNLFGMLRMIDWALPRFLQARRGHLVGVASVASYAGLPYNASYSGSKAAMRIHLQSLRVSLKHQGIAVTTICPGFVKSELTDSFDYPMPFLWETPRAAAYIVDAIEKRRGEVVFPWQMRLIQQALSRLLPVATLEWLLARGARQMK